LLKRGKTTSMTKRHWKRPFGGARQGRGVPDRNGKGPIAANLVAKKTRGEEKECAHARGQKQQGKEKAVIIFSVKNYVPLKTGDGRGGVGLEGRKGQSYSPSSSKKEG